MKMSGFYSKEELEAMHFKSLGKNVSISRKASFISYRRNGNRK